MVPTFLARFGRNLLYGFGRKLRPYETALLDRTLTASTPENRALLQRQIDSCERVRRWTDRVLYFGMPPKRQVLPINTQADEHCYAKIKLLSPLDTVTAKVMLFRGILHTVEFSKSTKILRSAEFRVESVTLDPGGTGYAEEIDDIEHGERSDT